jgi:hypothetical protein
MKRVSKFYPSNPETVEAYEQADINRIRPILREAKRLWDSEWELQGATDEGSCCGGKGIEIWIRAPRKRSAEPRNVISSPPVQGNISAQRSVKPALEYLAQNGIEATYNDGWVD